MITITEERYEKFVKAEHACEVIKKYIADETYINTTLIKLVLDMLESEDK